MSVTDYNSLIGQRFGNRVILAVTLEGTKKGTYVRCQCDCGRISDVCLAHMKQGRALACSDCRHGGPRPCPRSIFTCAKCERQFEALPNRAKKRYCSIECLNTRPPVPALERFWKNVEKTGECWIWTAGTNGDGYGSFGIPIGEKGRMKLVSAHRFSYEHHFGPIPDGLECLHSCDNPPCVRPDHLSIGTHSDNMQDCLAKGRAGFQRRRLPTIPDGREGCK